MKLKCEACQLDREFIDFTRCNNCVLVTYYHIVERYVGTLDYDYWTPATYAPYYGQGSLSTNMTIVPIIMVENEM